MSRESTFRTDVVYGSPYGLASQSVELSPGATIQDAIERSRFLERFEEIDLQKLRVGIYGTVRKLDTVLQPGDRVEIYRPITCDPEAVPRRDRDAPASSPSSQATRSSQATPSPQAAATSDGSAGNQKAGTGAPTSRSVP